MTMTDWTMLHEDDAEENRALLELRDGDVLRVFRYRRDKATGKETGYVQDLPSIQGAFATPGTAESGP